MPRNFLKPFQVAMGGVVYAFKTQKHMRFHLYSLVGVILLSVFVDFRLREMIVLLFVISFVVVAEMFNSAIEAVVDLVHPTYSPMAKFAKDMAAGGVLITTVTAIVVGLLLLLGDGRWQEIQLQLSGRDVQTQFAAKIILGLSVLFVLVVVGKGLGRKGQVLKGGLVSGHAAYGFFFAVVVIYLTDKLVPSIIAVLLAAMIAQSRWESKIHSLAELSFGAALGSLLAFLLFGLSPR